MKNKIVLITIACILICSFMAFALLAITLYLASSDSSKIDQYYDLDTIVKDNQLSEYEVIAHPGPPGPYRVLIIHKFAPGQDIVGTATVKKPVGGTSKYTFRYPMRNNSDEETIQIILQDTQGAVGTAILIPSRNSLPNDSSTISEMSNDQTKSTD